MDENTKRFRDMFNKIGEYHNREVESIEVDESEKDVTVIKFTFKDKE